MISISPLISLLSTKPPDFNGDWFRRVDGIFEYAALGKEKAIPMPYAWLVRRTDTPTHWGERTEDVVAQLDIIIGLSHVRTHSAGDGDDKMLAYRLAVKSLLLGYQLANAQPLKYQGGSLWDTAGGNVFWKDTYQFQALVTNYLPDPPLYNDLHKIGSNL